MVPPGPIRGTAAKVELYSISAPSNGEDGAGKVLSTTCKRVLEEIDMKGTDPDHPDRELKHQLFTGSCSNYLCNLQEGDEVMVTGPAGKRFLLPEEPERHDYLLLATGTGIAPFRGMIKDLLEAPTPSKSDVHLVMGVPYTTDLLYDDFFRFVGLPELPLPHRGQPRDPARRRTGRLHPPLPGSADTPARGPALAGSNPGVHVRPGRHAARRLQDDGRAGSRGCLPEGQARLRRGRPRRVGQPLDQEVRAADASLHARGLSGQVRQRISCVQIDRTLWEVPGGPGPGHSTVCDKDALEPDAPCGSGRTRQSRRNRIGADHDRLEQPRGTRRPSTGALQARSSRRAEDFEAPSRSPRIVGTGSSTSR